MQTSGEVFSQLFTVFSFVHKEFRLPLSHHFKFFICSCRLQQINIDIHLSLVCSYLDFVFFLLPMIVFSHTCTEDCRSKINSGRNGICDFIFLAKPVLITIHFLPLVLVFKSKKEDYLFLLDACHGALMAGCSSVAGTPRS